jgi:DNA recombination protein RmuC
MEPTLALIVGVLAALLLAVGILGGYFLAARKRAESADALETMKKSLNDAFRSVSTEALKDNSQMFLDLAKTRLETFQAEAKGDLALRQQEVEKLITPLKEQLDRLHQHNLALEQARNLAYGGLSEQVKALALSQQKLESATSDLVSVLRQPQQRGRWGEVQLDNVLRTAGMLAGLDFVKQPTLSAGEGRLRPDVIVYLPDGGQIIVDAKAPVDAFLNAYEAATVEEREILLKDHIRLVKNHVATLSGREYWSQFERTPEWVVMFVPVESFLTAAFAEEPDLIAESVRQRVILASPITLIALLTAVAAGWRQKRMEERVEEIGRAGAEIYDRLATFAEHLGKVGKSLQSAADAYDSSIGSLQRSLLPSARKIKELDAPITREMTEPQPLEVRVREIQAGELRRAGKDQ